MNWKKKREPAAPWSKERYHLVIRCPILNLSGVRLSLYKKVSIVFSFQYGCSQSRRMDGRSAAQSPGKTKIFRIERKVGY